MADKFSSKKFLDTKRRKNISTTKKGNLRYYIIKGKHNLRVKSTPGNMIYIYTVHVNVRYIYIYKQCNNVLVVANMGQVDGYQRYNFRFSVPNFQDYIVHVLLLDLT